MAPPAAKCSSGSTVCRQTWLIQRNKTSPAPYHGRPKGRASGAVALWAPNSKGPHSRYLDNTGMLPIMAHWPRVVSLRPAKGGVCDREKHPLSPPWRVENSSSRRTRLLPGGEAKRESLNPQNTLMRQQRCNARHDSLIRDQDASNSVCGSALLCVSMSIYDLGMQTISSTYRPLDKSRTIRCQSRRFNYN